MTSFGMFQTGARKQAGKKGTSARAQSTGAQWAYVSQIEGSNRDSLSTQKLRAEVLKAVRAFYTFYVDKEEMTEEQIERIKKLCEKEAFPAVTTRSGIIGQWLRGDSIVESMDLKDKVNIALGICRSALMIRAACGIPKDHPAGYLNLKDASYNYVTLKGYTTDDMKAIIEILAVLKGTKTSSGGGATMVENSPMQSYNELMSLRALSKEDIQKIHSSGSRLGFVAGRAAQFQSGSDETSLKIRELYDELLKDGKLSASGATAAGSFNQLFTIDRPMALAAFFSKCCKTWGEVEAVIQKAPAVLNLNPPSGTARDMLIAMFPELSPALVVKGAIPLLGSPTLMNVSRLRECLCTVAPTQSFPMSALINASKTLGLDAIIEIHRLEKKAPREDPEDRSAAARGFLRICSANFEPNYQSMNVGLVGKDLATIMWKLETTTMPGVKSIHISDADDKKGVAMNSGDFGRYADKLQKINSKKKAFMKEMEDRMEKVRSGFEGTTFDELDTEDMGTVNFDNV